MIDYIDDENKSFKYELLFYRLEKIERTKNKTTMAAFSFGYKKWQSIRSSMS